MRSKFSISLPEPMAAYVRRRTTGFHFASVSEYIRHLIRLDQLRNMGASGVTRPVRDDQRRDADTGRWR